ncbi:DUF4234 domain-containing protein [Actinomadura viridis]|uniref:DUF4234 domain-containing protein n=1 Tax=Actinomadura viridis TaxID=58110 RepID=UPI003699632F
MSYPQGQAQQPYQQQHQGGQAPVHTPHNAPAAAGSGLNMKKRNPVGAWLGLPIITFGIYGLVWFFKVHAELFAYDRRTGDAAVNALLSLLFGAVTLGIWPLIMFVKLGGRIAQAQRAAGLQPSCSGGIGFLLGIFGFGVLYYQIQLNKITDRYGDIPAGQQVSLAA